LDSKPHRMHPIISSNLREQIENEVRSAIIKGRYQPGDRLIESAIANEMGVSRAPVREVFSALEREGLVVNIPRHGNFVVEFTHKDIEEIYSLRLLLEVGAVKQSVDRYTQFDLDHLQRLINDLDNAMVRQDDTESIADLDMCFHEYLCSLANHSRIFSIWKGIRLQTQLLINVTSKTHFHYPHEPAQWHQMILDAIKSKNMIILERKISEHILDGQNRAMKALTDAHRGEAENSI